MLLYGGKKRKLGRVALRGSPSEKGESSGRLQFFLGRVTGAWRERYFPFC